MPIFRKLSKIGNVVLSVECSFKIYKAAIIWYASVAIDFAMYV